MENAMGMAFCLQEGEMPWILIRPASSAGQINKLTIFLMVSVTGVFHIFCCGLRLFDFTFVRQF